VQVDEVQAHEGRKPTKVKRTYDKVAGEVKFGDNTLPLESPFEGSTLALTGDDENVKVEFLEGKKPDHEGAMDGHKLGLALDALLPEKDVEKDAHWDLDSAQIKHALGLDLRKALFPPPPAPEGAGGGGGGGGGGRRGGMGRGGGMGGIPGDAEWTGKAKLVSLDEEVDGQKCAKIEIEIGTHGELPDMPMGGGRRGRMLEPENAPLFANTYSYEAKGEFYFSIDGKRPVKLELEGTAETVRDSEGKTDQGTFKMHRKQQGKLKVKIAVTEEAKAKDAKAK
jgi:hypothetical protein